MPDHWRPAGERLIGAATGARWVDSALLAYARSFEHPMKLRFVRWLARRLPAGRVLIRHALETTVAVDPADYIGWALVREGTYEPASLDLALRIMAEEGGLFVDIGAHFGLYSCAVGALAGVRVIAVEPDCENCTMLRANVAINGRRNIAVVNVAVGSQIGMAQTLRRSNGNSGTVAVSSDKRQPGAAGNWVAIARLQDVLERLVDPPARPALIKIDVEGFERHVLAGLDLAGSFRPKNIIMEFARTFAEMSWGSFNILAKFFVTNGYELLDVYGRPACDNALPEDNLWAREKAT